jgi:predicted O-methyltransferase YrrM
MYLREPQRGDDGLLHPLDRYTRISVPEGLCLYEHCVESHVRSTLEIGLGYGFSTVFLLAAHERSGGGRHLAVDPFQSTDWHGVGVTTARRLAAGADGLATGSFTWVAARSDAALVSLEQAGERFGLVFIDGYHRFDDVLVDFTLSARMVPVGGLVVLHDMHLAGVKAVSSWIRHDRPDFVRVPTGCRNLFAARRVGDDTRDWRHFVPFATR